MDDSSDFDWDELHRRLGESELSNDDRLKLAEAIKAILDWLLKVDLTKKRSLKIIGMRTLAMAWVVDPKRLNGDSLRSIGKQVGMSRGAFNRHSSEFSKLFAIVNQHQKHDCRRK